MKKHSDYIVIVNIDEDRNINDIYDHMMRVSALSERAVKPEQNLHEEDAQSQCACDECVVFLLKTRCASGAIATKKRGAYYAQHPK